MTENPNPVPEWMDGKKINEALFCREFLEQHMHLCFVRLTADKRLSAKDIVGNRKKVDPVAG
ncbi:MAG: hypothetical protein ACI4PH_05660 [Faecousia sp.]